jgi:CheY-like chemotaxis protein
MDGFQATRHIRERERADGTHVVIIAMTAHAVTGYREKCLTGGMDGYVAKPIRMAELECEIARCVSPAIEGLLCA